jgi:hypothetical protein
VDRGSAVRTSVGVLAAIVLIGTFAAAAGAGNPGRQAFVMAGSVAKPRPGNVELIKFE